jgi:hypothetical protein
MRTVKTPSRNSERTLCIFRVQRPFLHSRIAFFIGMRYNNHNENYCEFSPNLSMKMGVWKYSAADHSSASAKCGTVRSVSSPESGAAAESFL